MMLVRHLPQLQFQFSEVFIYTTCKLFPKEFKAILQSEYPPILLEMMGVEIDVLLESLKWTINAQ